MAYDEHLAQRVRNLVNTDGVVSEKAMFGGLAFLVNGNMAVAITGRDELMVRVNPTDTPELVKTPGVSKMVMRGREMNGWLLVVESEITTERKLAKWVTIGTSFATTLPPKR